VKYRNIGQRFGSARNGDVNLSERNLVGGIGDCLVRGGAGAADRECLHSFGQQGKE
jgi:hypothetical protein